MPSLTEIQEDALQILNAAPGNFLILMPDAPRFTIAGVTESYLEITFNEREKIIGRGLFEAFPDDPSLRGVTGADNLYESLRHVLQYKREHHMGELRYDVPDANGKFVFKIWRSMNRPVLDDTGAILYIIHSTEDVTEQVRTEQKKARAEARYRSIFEAVAVSIWEKDYTAIVAALLPLREKLGKALRSYLENHPAEVYRLLSLVRTHDINTASMKIFEAERKAQLLDPPAQIYTDESLPAFIDELMALAENEKSFEAECTLQTLKGKKIVCLTTVTFPKDGDYSSILVTYADITGLKKAEEALKESERRFRTMINSIPQLAWMTDENGWIYWYNDRWYDYTGTTPEEMMGWGWRKVHHPDLVEGVVDRISRAFASESAWEDIFLLRSREGHYRWFLSRALPVRREDGTLVGWFGTNTDITEQRLTEEALEKSEEQLLLALEGGELGYFDFNPRTNELVWSDRTKELFGLPRDAEVDFNVYLGALYPEDRERTQAAIRKALDPANGVYENEYRVIGLKDGRLRWLRSKGKVFFDAEGQPHRLSGVILDITAQKEAEAALQQSESNLRNLVLQAPVAMCIGSGPSFVVEEANDRMLEIMGKRAAEIIGRPVFEVLPEAGEQGLKEVIQQIFITGERFTANEMPVILPRNQRMEPVYLNFVYEPIMNRDGSITRIIAVAIDVTDQVVARKEIEESHREFQFAMDFVPQMIWLAWPDGDHYYYNKKWYDYTGLTFEETKGEGWKHVFHPDDREQAGRLWRHCLQTGEPYQIEFRARRHDGTYRWFLTRALPLKNEAGTIIKWFGTDTDIHDQKTFTGELEEKVAERTHALQQSNEDLQQFVHVSSHDLKEPVRKIRFFANRLCDDAEGCLDEKSKVHLTRVQAAADRMSQILDGVLAYSKVNFEEALYEPVDLNAVMADVVSDLELPIAEKGASIRYGDLPQLMGAPIMLHLVFYNLLSNALKFAKAGVPPEIRITSSGFERKGQAFARIIVQDNGIGFEQKYAEKIFGTFTRLHSKDLYEGAGLGLSICKKIIERHGGNITAKSETGGGTAFEILLPAGSHS